MKRAIRILNPRFERSYVKPDDIFTLHPGGFIEPPEAIRHSKTIIVDDEDPEILKEYPNLRRAK